MKKTEVWHSVILLAILGGGLAGMYLTSGNRKMQLVVGVVTTAAYIMWGITHHGTTHDLHHKVVIEYMLIGAIALVLLFTLAL